jgi:DDE superfamily endonuclease
VLTWAAVFLMPLAGQRAGHAARPGLAGSVAASLPHLDPQKLVFIDESGLNVAMTRLYGRAPRGQRVIGAVPQNYGERLTVLAAWDREGIRAALAVDGATDGPVFLTFLQRVLGPRLRPGEVVVLDNLRAHPVAGVTEALAQVGAKLRYLPPYSPDYNPIELAWSKVKPLLGFAPLGRGLAYSEHCAQRSKPSRLRTPALGFVTVAMAHIKPKFAVNSSVTCLRPMHT